MAYYLRFLFYNRYAQPHYKPLGADTLVDEEPPYERGKAYQIRLFSFIDDSDMWPSFVVTNVRKWPQGQTTLVEVSMVLEEEHEQFVALFQNWELN